MKVFNFENIHTEYSSVEEIEMSLSASPEMFVFQINIERARHYSDLAQSYLEVAYIGQELTKYSERLDFNVNWDLGYNPVAQLTLKPKDIKGLSSLIYLYGNIYSGDYEDLSLEFMEGLQEYRETLEEKNHSFPEIVDDYYANYINGEYHEYSAIENADFFKDEFSRFPERKHGFWKSALCGKIGQLFYVSAESWIIPNSSDLTKILKEYPGIEGLNFEKASFFAIGNISYISSNGLMIHFPFGPFIQAKHCASVAFEENEYFMDENNWMNRFLTFDRSISIIDNSKENFRGYPEDRSEELILSQRSNNDFLLPPPVISFYVSAYGDHLLIKDAHYSYLFFGTDKLTYSELGYLGDKLSVLFNTTANLAGIHVEINCPWEQLDDDKFEEVCYDIIYYNPKFDNSTIRKMGKSRSRDGGRDIEVFTHQELGKQKKKYIFQCKYLKPGSSLTASKVTAISDTIAQYGASGYGIMTNVVIDATLYDKMDGIGRNKEIEVEDYSVYKLERILSRYPQIKKRHFKL